MNDFNSVIDNKECPCTKCDKIYVELDSLVERSDIDYEEIKRLIESCNIQKYSISYTMCIKKKSPNYKSVHKFFKKLFKKCRQNEN